MGKRTQKNIEKTLIKEVINIANKRNNKELHIKDIFKIAKQYKLGSEDSVSLVEKIFKIAPSRNLKLPHNIKVIEELIKNGNLNSTTKISKLNELFKQRKVINNKEFKPKGFLDPNNIKNAKEKIKNEAKHILENIKNAPNITSNIVDDIIEGNSFDRLVEKSKTFSKDTSKLFKKMPSWLKISVGIAAGYSAIRYGQEHISNRFNKNKRYLPNEYADSYDLIKEQFTDFGSPVHLEKLFKVIMPRPSTTRNGLITNTASIIKRNDALFLHRNAIGHTRYN